MRQRQLGDLQWVVTVSRPDTCARWAPIASKINALCESDVYRINELVLVAEAWQRAMALKYASSSHPWETLGLGDRAQQDMRHRREKAHCGSMSLARWSDAAYGGQSAGGKCRLGYVIGLIPSTYFVDFATHIQFHQEAGEKQSGPTSLRAR